ncbi:MAG: hypothetical protein HY677_01460 [Chloroflexi bacterium]|nr:hypothetical protein [Chloroflexota bacterium]
MKALILAPFSSEGLARLRGRMEVVHESWMETQRLYDPEELGQRLGAEGIDFLVVEADFIFPELLEQAPNLKLVGICRQALNHVDIDSATERGVVIVNTPARNATAVAELTIGLMLSLARQIPSASILVANGGWNDPVLPYLTLRGVELAGKTAGIVGLGAIGSRVARRLCAMEMQVLGYDPYVDEASATQMGVTLAPLEEMIRQADFLSLHLPSSSRTAGIISSSRIDSMKPTAFLVNTASYAAVDENALVAALRESRLAGAAFDVFETHPIAESSPLLKLPNVILTPHIGGATDETVARHSRMIVRDIERFLDGQPPLNMVNAEVWTARVR